MATALENKLDRILQEKTTKIIPNNIRQGIKIFDVTGTLNPSGGGTTINILDVNDYTTSVSDSTLIFSPPYTELEYIQSTGTQYIDLNYNTTSNFGFEIDCQIISGGNLFGGGNSSNHPYMNIRNSKTIYIDYDGNYNEITFENPRDNARHIYKLIRGSSIEYDYYLDTTKLGTVTGNHPANIAIVLFTYADSGVARQDAEMASCKFYSLKLYNGSNLVRDLIPVKDLNNVICMYDKVSRNFFYNAGTSSFIAGPEV